MRPSILLVTVRFAPGGECRRKGGGVRFSGRLCGCTFFQFFLRRRSFTSSDTHVVNISGETDSHRFCLAFDFLQIRVTAEEFNDANKNGPHVCFP